MFIDYGVNDSGELVYIEQAVRGLTGLTCPYCGGALKARKGTIKAHHFAHAGETCRQAARDQDVIGLPVYDRFTLNLPGKALSLLKQYTEDAGKLSRGQLDYLHSLDLVVYNGWKGRGGGWELTRQGKIPLGELSLMLFNQFQEPLLLEKHAALEDRARAARGTVDFQMALTDLRLYRAQYRRLLASTLYFLKIGGGPLYKIGVTTRPMAERLAEIRADLQPQLGPVAIEVLDVWPMRGNVELYFKHRYQAARQPLGDLTEYFAFEEVKGVLRDLRRMKARTLTPVEQGILDGEPSDLDKQLIAEEAQTRRRALIRRGMAYAARQGVHVGRPVQPAATLLAKPASHQIRAALERGLSLRATARLVGVSVNTVRKVKAALEHQK